jgi:glycosyltransferase involved in cell wall biosynthesis
MYREPFSVVTPTASADGYGVSGESLILAAKRSHDAEISVIGYDWADERYTDPELLAMKCDPYLADAHDLLVVYFLPFALTRFSSRCTVNMTMWETDRLPDQWARLLKLADGVVVPSEHCKVVFQQRVDCPVEAVPFGTDTDLYSYINRRGDLTRNRSLHPYYFGPEVRNPHEFVFLMSGALHYRKGVDFALRALREEFTGGEPVRLVLKTRRGFFDFVGEAAMLSDARVTVIDEDYTREQMRDLYHMADCFLAPSRGEGSGLTPRDAMSTGLPTIATEWGGLKELTDSGCVMTLRVEDLEEAPQENTSYGVGVTGGGDIGNFARPDVAHLRTLMREAYEDRESGYSLGYDGAQLMRSEYTWRDCAGKWLNALELLKAAA